MAKFENDQQFNIPSTLSKNLSTLLIPITIVLHIICTNKITVGILYTFEKKAFGLHYDYRTLI